MKNKIPKLVKELLKKYDLYYNCCDVCDIRCCKGHTILTIDDIDYIVDTTGVVPVLVQYPIVPVAVAPTTLINAPVGTTLVIPTNNDGGCVNGFISQVVTITGGGLSIPVTSYPVDLCTALNGLVVTAGTTSLTITSTVTTACGTDTDTYVLSIDQAAGVITGVNGVSCSPVITPEWDSLSCNSASELCGGASSVLGVRTMPIVGISTFPYYVYDGTTGVLVNSSADVAALFNLMNFGGSSAWVANAVNGGVYVTGATSSYNNLSATVSFRYSDNINGIGGTCRVYNIGANGQCLSKP